MEKSEDNVGVSWNNVSYLPVLLDTLLPRWWWWWWWWWPAVPREPGVLLLLAVRWVADVGELGGGVRSTDRCCCISAIGVGTLWLLSLLSLASPRVNRSRPSTPRAPSPPLPPPWLRRRSDPRLDVDRASSRSEARFGDRPPVLSRSVAKISNENYMLTGFRTYLAE